MLYISLHIIIFSYIIYYWYYILFHGIFKNSVIPCIVHFAKGVVLHIVRELACAHGCGNPDHGLLVKGEGVEHLIRVLDQGKLGDWGEVPVQGPLLDSVEL